MDRIPLVKNTISNEEIDSLIDWLRTYPRLTQGDLVREFQNSWSSFLNIKNSLFVNSGSSALLIAYYALKLMNLKNNYVVVPGLSWATDLAPIIQLGFHPILCDCNLDDLSLDISHLEEIIEKYDPAIINLVSVLGLVPDMDKIIQLKNKHDFYLLEDVCESFGSEYKNQKLGTFGDVSVFSLYYGHHLSTIEGGMVCTNNSQLYDLLLMLRSHGWDRDLSKAQQARLRQKYNVDDFAAPYTFYYAGFNLRATDLQAFLGLQQLEKAETIIKKRYENFIKILNNTNIDWKPKNMPHSLISNFCYPVISPNKKEIIEHLEVNKVECRPLICGSMGNQPFYKDNYGFCSLKNCEMIDEKGFYVPNNPDLTDDELEKIINAINLK